MSSDFMTVPPNARMRGALLLAILADIFQIAVFPLFVAGGASPADDVLDLGIAALMTVLLGWHWEFLPSFLGKLVPGVDFVPLWTLAVANVYRKQRRLAPTARPLGHQPPTIDAPHRS
ncbi:hypothetical protein DYQ86_26690 [Acidobacteria bacterium AB60]|nr:hypothetical protein DYQ86_26690 [Acidobacteria bacterium AB60]